MRNLRNLHHQLLSHHSSSSLASCAWDTSSGSTVCVFGPSANENLIELRRWPERSSDDSLKNEESVHVASWDAPCPNPALSFDKVLNVHYFSDSHETCIVLAGGDITSVSAATAERQQQIEIVGSVDAGIAAAAWSPDEELLALLTNADTLLYMTRDFDNVASVNLLSDDLKASKHVSVGWGKSETQFRGKGARALKDPTVPDRVDEGLVSSKDLGESNISWRGDGTYVAVNSCSASPRRVIRVYSREGELDGVSEPVDYMEGALSWRPAGNLMASVQRLEQRIDVIFFERNGLRHGQFSLRLSEEEMNTWASKLELHWNVDSSVLAVCFLDRIQLWTMGNYHYYLKQEIRLPKPERTSNVLYFAWHPEKPLLFAVGSEGCVQRYQYAFRVTSGSKIPPHDSGLVSVIDGASLKITPLRISNVPPPMAFAEVAVGSNIVDVCYFDTFPEDKSSVMLAVLDQISVSVFHWSLKEKAIGNPTLKARYEVRFVSESNGDGSGGHLLRQISFVDPEIVLILASNGRESILNTLRLSDVGFKSVNIGSHEPVAEVVTVATHAKPTLYLWTGSRLTTFLNFSTYDSMSNALQSSNGSSIKTYEAVSSRIESVIVANPRDFDADEDSSSAPVVFALERNGMLFANQRCIARGCTSFLATASHLIFTTSQHLLKFAHLTNAEALEIPEDTPEVDERCRSIERGARIITVIPSTSALILQMPRGNLETIYPRALVLPLIRGCINENKYKKAFLACRNHRVDMNILYDHDPKKFLQSVDAFVDQLRKVEHIDLFLSQLREEDVSQTMYKDTIPNVKVQTMDMHNAVDPKPVNLSDTSKVNKICHAFLISLYSRKSTNSQNMITAHVCKNPPDLEAGLIEVAGIRTRNQEDGDRVVEHICFLADVNRLYDTALGLYDLDLALQIAQQSQKDPREYIPFLQKLKDQEPLRMKVGIDNYLRRFEKVLQHLQELSDFEAFRTHTIRHSLFEEAMMLYRYQENRIQTIMQSYAQYLRDHSKHKDAGVAYEYLRDYEAAVESYRSAHLWQESLTCASLARFDQERMQTLALSLAESLAELKNYRAAATIYIDYFNNIEEAARLFCKGYHIADATRLISRHHRPDLVHSIVDTGLAEGQAAMTELLAECKNQLNAQIPRIRELREKKAREPLSFYDADVNGGTEVPDNISLAGTDASTAGGTLFTRYTNRTGTVNTNATRKTSKKKRQEERKRARGKKGSVYEEEYLVNSIARLIERVNAVNEEVQRLVTGLMRRSMRERARAVQIAMVTVVDLCKEHVAEVFQIPVEQQTEGSEDAEIPEMKPRGGDAVLFDSMEETRAPKAPPVIKDFHELSILGR